VRETRAKIVDAKTIAVIRTDRMGDLILTTPLFQAIKEASPEARVLSFASPYAAPVIERNPHVDETILWRNDAREMSRALAARRPEAAILLNPSFRACAAVWRAGIPFRTGPLSRPSSFLFLNRGIRQTRSRSPRHQSELDAAFAPLVTGGRARGASSPLLFLAESEREEGARLLERCGAGGRSPLAGLHAGSGDSALRWPEEHDLLLGRLLRDDGWSIVLTGSASERPRAERLARAIGPGAFVAAGGGTLRSFFGLLSHLNLFIAPSTGPLHAAAALGVPVASPYPPLPSQSPARWGPRTERAAVLVPPVECPARIRCKGARCPHHPCMERIDPRDLREAIRARVEQEARPA